MEWKWNGTFIREKVDTIWNEKGMEVLSEKKSTPDGTEMEWTRYGNGMEKIW